MNPVASMWIVAGAIPPQSTPNQEATLAIGMFLIGFFTMLAILHLFLYGFNRGISSNLYIAILDLMAVALTAIALLRIQNHDPRSLHQLTLIREVLITLSFPTLVLLAYSLFHSKMPSISWVWFGFSLFILILDRNLDFAYKTLCQLVMLAEVARTVIQAMIRKKPGVWIVGIGLLVAALSIPVEIFWLADSTLGLAGKTFGLPFYGGLFLMVSLTFLLARQFAATNRQLALRLEEVKKLSDENLQKERQAREQEVRARLLEADNRRKTRELEEARELQLSMLPQKLPELGHLRIETFMQTATEVGGDYYDFHLDEERTLTVTLGDATGHGIKAGTMVAAVKSLFSVLATKQHIPDIFIAANRALKKMKMRNMFMAMSLLKIRDHRVAVSAAGMPPLLLFRAGTQSVETHLIKGLPLGGVAGFPYREQEIEVEVGDVLLLMSDGLPELFNSSDEMFGEERVQNILREKGSNTPGRIIEALLDAAKRWAGERPQDDDITLVVIQVTG